MPFDKRHSVISQSSGPRLDSIAASLFVLNWLSWQIVYSSIVSDDKIQITILILRRGALSSHGVHQIIWPHWSKDNCCTSTRPSQSAGSCPFPPGLWLQTPTWRALQIQTKVMTKIVALRTSKPFHHATFLTLIVVDCWDTNTLVNESLSNTKQIWH